MANAFKFITHAPRFSQANVKSHSAESVFRKPKRNRIMPNPFFAGQSEIAFCRICFSQAKEKSHSAESVFRKPKRNRILPNPFFASQSEIALCRIRFSQAKAKSHSAESVFRKPKRNRILSNLFFADKSDFERASRQKDLRQSQIQNATIQSEAQKINLYA
jgi:predicted RNase H-like nuclease